MLRYLSALNAAGDSGLTGFGASCAAGAAAISATAVPAIRDRNEHMRGSLAYGRRSIVSAAEGSRFFLLREDRWKYRSLRSSSRAAPAACTPIATRSST